MATAETGPLHLAAKIVGALTVVVGDAAQQIVAELAGVEARGAADRPEALGDERQAQQAHGQDHVHERAAALEEVRERGNGIHGHCSLIVRETQSSMTTSRVGTGHAPGQGQGIGPQGAAQVFAVARMVTRGDEQHLGHRHIAFDGDGIEGLNRLGRPVRWAGSAAAGGRQPSKAMMQNGADHRSSSREAAVTVTPSSVARSSGSSLASSL